MEWLTPGKCVCFSFRKPKCHPDFIPGSSYGTLRCCALDPGEKPRGDILFFQNRLRQRRDLHQMLGDLDGIKRRSFEKLVTSGEKRH